MSQSGMEVVIIGAGPAGLTAAYELCKRGVQPTVLEQDTVVGGISRTVEADGWHFDIGGHRFFTKVGAVERLWHEILDDDEFLTRPRMSRIFYRGSFFDYPLKPMNALRGLGLREAALCVLSYAWARVRPPKDQTTFEGWTSARFGTRLYRIFFKTYTEKVWGVPATEIQADWAVQRIKNLSLMRAVANAVMPRRGPTVTSLIEEFQYPKLGPGMMWERAQEIVQKQGAQVLFDVPVNDIRRVKGAAVSVVVPKERAFPDNWIYVHSPEVRLGRVQNFGNWSPFMFKDGLTCLGLEYFVFEGDDLWVMADDDLVELGRTELATLGLVDPSEVLAGYVVRMPKAYPMYDDGYKANVEAVRTWLEDNVPNVHPVGRNGMHRYNNQDHSMYTAMLTVENLFGARHDIWAVNVDADYCEEKRVGAEPSPNTGRDAPVTPRGRRQPPASGAEKSVASGVRHPEGS